MQDYKTDVFKNVPKNENYHLKKYDENSVNYFDGSNLEEKLQSVSINRKLLILYGGETGNSEDLAKRIGWQAILKKFKVIVLPFDAYDIKNLIEEKLILFICSTTNQGDEPNCMNYFWKFLMRKNLPDGILSDLKTAVIGLGDSSYLYYNVVGKKLYKRLIQLGVDMLLDLCLGDDQHDLGLDAAVDEWLPKFWTSIANKFNFNLTYDEEDSDNLKKSLSVLYNVEVIEKQSQENKFNNLENSKFSIKNYYKSKVIENKRVTSENHFQETVLVKLKIEKSIISFEPGDVVMILPRNSREDVNDFIEIFNLDPNKKIKIDRINDRFLGFNLYDTIKKKYITVLDLVHQYFDITSTPKRSFFEVLYLYASDNEDNKLEKEKLKEFSSTKGQYALYEYCKKPKRNILEVLIDFPKTTSNLNLEDLIQLIPPIFARPYSIANDINQFKNQLHVLCAVKKTKTMLKKPRLGLCSNFLKNLKKNDSVSIFIKQGNFQIMNKNNPLILIATGTGIAPFRSFIQNRFINFVKPTFLFFGCRYKNKDFYFRQEFDDLTKNCSNETSLISIPFKYFTAFSRDQNEKIYIQNKLWENKKMVFDLIKNYNAYVFICGSSNQMPNEVRKMLIKIFESEGDKNLVDNEAENYFKKLELEKKIQFECWS